MINNQGYVLHDNKGKIRDNSVVFGISPDAWTRKNGGGKKSFSWNRNKTILK